MSDVRASDTEREATIERLRVAAGEGRLDLEQLADRIEAAGASGTRTELERLTGDLPAPRTAGTELSTVPIRCSTVFGDVRRGGRWIVPELSRWESLFGDVVLDLREAQVTAGEVTVDAGTIFGDVDVLVPEGVLVEVRSRVLFGDVRQQAGEVGPAGAPRVVLVGGTVFGDVKVRSSRLRDRLAVRLRRGDRPLVEGEGP